jgi:hypothetical protein
MMAGMPGDLTHWGTDEWEKHIQKLLKRRYLVPGTYQHIPSETHGDCGLEGYAADGTGYQCYSAQDWADPKTLYEKQRDKITKDIGKFLTRETELLQILGSVKIKIWNLVVPYWKNKDLLIHAKTKEKLVQSVNPAHADQGFRIAVITADDFAVERQELANAGLNSFDVAPQTIADSALANWLQSATNIGLIANLNRKTAAIVGSQTCPAYERFRIRVVKDYISGEIALKKLENDLPDTFKRVGELKEQKEADLDTETVTLNIVPSQFFQDTLESYQKQLSTTPGLSQRTTHILAREAVSDWLLRCPLEFDNA